MATLLLARQAMATRFEVSLHGAKSSHLQAAAEEALDEISRLDAQLSLYNPGSDVYRINAHAAENPVKLEPRLFHLIHRAREYSRLTEGAFDLTIAPLVRCWGFMGGSGAKPSEEEIAAARERIGWERVVLDEKAFTIAFEVPGMMLDFGAIGKGYALDCAVEILREAGIENCLIHGGTSTVFAMGQAPNAEDWQIALEEPPAASGALPSSGLLRKVRLSDRALSVSAVWGKSFSTEGRNFGHVIDPRTGAPADRALMAVVLSLNATATDALSTALLTLGEGGLSILGRGREFMGGLVLAPQPQPPGYSLHQTGLGL